jgi:hypothetical protein
MTATGNIGDQKTNIGNITVNVQGINSTSTLLLVICFVLDFGLVLVSAFLIPRILINWRRYLNLY